MDPKKILIAVDASENAARAVNYVAELLDGSSGFLVTVLYIERPPNRDMFPDEPSWVEAGQTQELRIRTFLQQAKTNLTGHGLAPETVTIAYVPHCQSEVDKQCTVQCSMGPSIARDNPASSAKRKFWDPGHRSARSVQSRRTSCSAA